MIRTRIAPSPSGYLHVGTAQSGIFNWLAAKSKNGQFILRIEDTDKQRSDKKFEEDIIEGFKWLGLLDKEAWVGEIYRQSERLDIYEQYLKKLLDSGKAFWCDHTKEELEAEQKGQASRKEAPRHICSHKKEKRTNGQVIRIAVDENSSRVISFDDEIRGEIQWQEKLIGDFSIAKDLKNALYNFVVVVDDLEMKVSHVVRGEDHISNTPKQILIYEALSGQIPKFAHLPLLLAPDRSKLSKRHGATSLSEYRKDYLPEALFNFLGALSYTFSKEIISKEEMVKEFELGNVHKSGAVFDIKKLNWINSQYIKSLNIERLRELAGIKEIPENALPLITERLEKLTDAQNFNYLWDEPQYDKNLLAWKKSTLEKSIETLAETKKIISALGGPASGWEIDKDEFRKVLDDFSVKVGDRGLVYWPLRVALSGKEKSPDPVDIAFVVGKEKTLERVGRAIDIN